MRIRQPADNFLLRQPYSALVIVKMSPSGAPDSVSYWQSPAANESACVHKSYTAGALLDIVV
ncbi:MAG: hypothetical protein KGL10_02135 [Alphaproteobacteria bacterium]|nr:hypothetical protein [Alphaproteobacteria bacterium]MDE2336088.1 hypothetical protein [Alphaproteobacteria bacterium]